jgi:anaerobic magnesium-protoporphyrin IX monomethyl ester cyclase
VFPTFHAADILAADPAVDAIVRGEGEATAVALADALARGAALDGVAGLSLRAGGRIVETPPAPPIADLDAFRVGWELVEDWGRHTSWGLGRAAVVQFSRGCPQRCSHCGQHAFWGRWRHRDPERLADEVARLHCRHGVRFVNLADENPAASKRVWRRLLEALAARAVPVRLFATIRAADVVRDADILPLYRAAGMLCVLMGIESTDPATLARIGKGSDQATDRRAIRLLRRHGILSMACHIVGFEEETWGTHRRALGRLLAYDPDLLNAMYVTPHRWAGWAAANGDRAVVQTDLARWDYRHQVLATRHLRPWQVFAAVKLTEAVLHLRPRMLWRALAHRDPEARRALRWCLVHAGRVWLGEIGDFALRTRLARRPRPLAEHFAASQPAGAEPAGSD